MGKAVSINRSKEFEPFVQKLAGEKAYMHHKSGKKLFPTIRELLTFCALIGFQNNKKIPIDKDKGAIDIQGVIYEDTEALDFIWLIALADTQSIGVLQDGNERDCANIFEAYANAGLAITAAMLTECPEELWHEKLFKLTEGNINAVS